jgi:hypothetical protein
MIMGGPPMEVADWFALLIDSNLGATKSDVGDATWVKTRPNTACYTPKLRVSG